MSWCNEDGIYFGRNPKTNAEDDVGCDGCNEPIQDCIGGKLYLWANSYYCKECLLDAVLEDLTSIDADSQSIYE